MRVLMLTTNSSLMDGINRHILAISGGLAKEGVDVGVCIVQRRGELAEELEKVGVKTYSLACANGHDWKILLRFFKVIQEFRPDVVHAHVMALFERLVLSWFFPNLKVFQTIHGISDPIVHKTCKMRLENILVKLSPLNSTSRIFISKGVKAAFGDQDGKVIYNPIDIREMAPRKLLRELIGASPEAFVIGTACRIAQVKNPQAFVRVMKGVIERCPDVHGVIIGDGNPELIAELKEISAGCANLHFLGYRADARQLLAECDCFVMTSAREGMPTAMLEAMASGVPIAFWNGEGGLIDLADLNNEEGPIGVVFDQGDEPSLVKGICRIVNKENRHGWKNKDVILRHFNLTEVSRKLKEIYMS